jgi:phosphopantetheine--protein transferase-like protein
MIGNDVVDLKLAGIQSNWQRKGYLNKIFTDLEQQLIANSNDKNNMVWQLWSRKEAVYKLLQQQGHARGYYPKKIECIDIKKTAGKVEFDSKFYFTNTYISINYVHSIAVIHQNQLNNVFSLNWNSNCFIIDQKPYLFKNNGFQNISKSHHGKFEKVVALNV